MIEWGIVTDAPFFMKICQTCKKEVSKSLFSKQSSSKDGLQAKCKPCTNEYMKQRLISKGEEINSKRKERYNENLEKYRLQAKESYFRHREKRIKAVSEYVEKNKDKRREYMRNYKSSRLRDDSLFNLKFLVSSLIRVGLLNRGYGKRTRTATILGCTWEEFHLHIERQFQKGMTWKNRNLWHIDHIIPLATATCEDDIIRLNHFTNLRPLWAEENQRKSARLEHLL
jgi:hypothetical protein